MIQTPSLLASSSSAAVRVTVCVSVQLSFVKVSVAGLTLTAESLVWPWPQTRQLLTVTSPVGSLVRPISTSAVLPSSSFTTIGATVNRFIASSASWTRTSILAVCPPNAKATPTVSSRLSASWTGATVIRRGTFQLVVVKVNEPWLPAVVESASTVSAPVSPLVTVTVTSEDGALASVTGKDVGWASSWR